MHHSTASENLSKNFIGSMICLAILAITAPIRAELVAPYATDSSTLHLWHFDETATPVVDFAPGGTNFTSLAGGATLGNASFAGFGTALSALDGGQSDVTAAGRDAVLSTRSPFNGTPTAMTYADPVTGAFTFEGIVKIGFDPAVNLGSTANGGNNRNTPMQVFSLESSTSNPGRIMQLRLDPRGFNPNAGGVTTPLGQPALDFINVHGAVAPVESFIALIPTNGPNAIVSNGWYHVAVTYNGMANTDNNLSFYWTLIDSSLASATPLASFKMINNLSASSTANPCFGNIGRTGANNNFLGLIDEFRISNVARGASGMLFASTNVGINTPPASQTVAVGQAASFGVTATGLPPYTYQWLHEGTNILGATQSVYAITSAQLTDAGGYLVIVSNNFTAATSSVATLTVRVASNLVWTGQSSLDWDFSTVNWIDANSAPSVFAQGDNVRFDAVGAGSFGGNVNLTATLSPSSIAVDANSDYTFLSILNNGKLSGTSKLTKSGSGTLVIEMDNNFTGPTTISGGTLQVGAAGTPGAKGSLGNGPLTNNAALVFNRTGALNLTDIYTGTGTLQNNAALAITITGTNTSSGNVTLNGGSLILSTPQAHGNFTNVTLNASLQSAGGTRLSIGGGSSYAANVGLSMLGTTATPDWRTIFAGIGGTNTWAGPIIVSGSGPAQISADSLDGPFNITGPITGDGLTGSLLLRGGGTGIISGTITLPNASVNKTDGSLWIIRSTGNFWPSSTIAATTLRIGANNALPTGLTLAIGQAGTGTATLDLGGFNQQIAVLSDGGANEFVGNSSTNSDSVLTITSTSSFGGNIVDALTNGTRKTSLTLIGGGILTLRSNNTYSGATTISAGTLALTGVGAIPNTAIINQSAGTTLDVSGRTAGSVTLGAAQKLKGDGAFNVLGTFTNNGTIELKVNKSGATLSNDSIQGLTQITYGGTLNLIVSGDTLTTSDSFKLFTAGTYANSFVTILPSVPAAGLSWDTGSLNTDGTLRIKVGPNQTPTNITFSVSGNALTLAWPSDHIGFRLQAQTNAINVGITTNWFDVTGSTQTNQVTATISQNNGTVFYRLIYP